MRQETNTPTGSGEGERRHFAIQTKVSFAVSSQKERRFQGTGTTVYLSRRTVVFRPHIPFAGNESQGRVMLLIEWPIKLDNGIYLDLRITGAVRRIDGELVTILVRQFEFLTRESSDARREVPSENPI